MQFMAIIAFTYICNKNHICLYISTMLSESDDFGECFVSDVSNRVIELETY